MNLEKQNRVIIILSSNLLGDMRTIKNKTVPNKMMTISSKMMFITKPNNGTPILSKLILKR